MDKRKRTGRRGEDIALTYLISKGYQLLERNWRCSTGELDIIMTDGSTLIFVEVRTRQGENFGLAIESVTPAKQARLIELAQTYLQQQSVSSLAWRIDVVAVQLGPGSPHVEHIENAVGWG